MTDSPSTAPVALPPDKPKEKPKGRPKAFHCPSCGGTITLKAVGHSVSAVCGQCFSVIDVRNDNLQLIEETRQRDRETLIPLGTRGVLFDKSWEVIGYMLRCDGYTYYSYSWEEYLLYNPYYGFRFLTQADGHWTFLEVVRRYIEGVGGREDVRVNGKDGGIYRLFNKSSAYVEYVKGEFYWRVHVNEQTTICDYIAPPAILSAEKSHKETVVSHGVYVDPSIVQAAFKLPEMPAREGVAPNQPSPYQGVTFAAIWLVAFLACVVAFFMFRATVIGSQPKEVFAASYTVTPYNPYNKEGTLSSNNFLIPKQGNVYIETWAPDLDNNWLELTATLVNIETNETLTVTQAMEYYHGRDSDGDWAEGHRTSSVWLSAVPPGTYKLLLDVDAGALNQGRQVQFSTRVVHDFPTLQNFWATVLLVLVYPLFISVRRYLFEEKRWSQSDYAPELYRPSEWGDDDA